MILFWFLRSLTGSQDQKRLENARKDQEKKEREEAEFLALKLEVEEKNPTIRSQLYVLSPIHLIYLLIV
jgi:hypothetical protein